MTRLIGPSNRLFADPSPGADETSFQVANDSDAYYQSPYYTLHASQLQPIPSPRYQPPVVDFAQVVGPELTSSIQASKRIVFHAVGDTGAAKVDQFQTVAAALAHEASVADAMSDEVARLGVGGPAFFFHLGDIIYYFGEAAYYYDQFYEPYRAYDRPIFAVPGNHDGAVIYDGGRNAPPQTPTLTGYLTNFCAPAPGLSPNAGSILRSTMTQPGPYFTLDAPYVSIIGLYTNVLEGPGVISSQGGKYPIGDDQLTFLESELTRLAELRTSEPRAILLACHHPPLSIDATHGGSTGLSKDIDTACASAGVWPDAVLSGHAHLYQRFTRTMHGRQIPYVVSGSGGYAATAPQTPPPPAGTTVGDTTLNVDPIVKFGYLYLTVDVSTSAPTLTIEFRVPMATGGVGAQGAVQDSVTIDLAAHALLPVPTPPPGPSSA
jgi:hypothetical protein